MPIDKLLSPRLGAPRLSRNPNYKPDAMQATLIEIVRLFNETVEAQAATQFGDELRRVLLKGVVFNLHMIDELLHLVEPARQVDPSVEDLRHCITHFDERIKKFYNSPKPVVPSAFSSPNITYRADGSVSVSGLSLDGVALDIDSSTRSAQVSSPFGIINNATLIALDRDGNTIQIRVDARLLSVYRKDIEAVVAKYS